VAYLPSVAVIYTELIKLGICVGAQGGVCLRTSGERGLTLREEISHQSREILGRSWPMVVPAGLFVMQQVTQIPFCVCVFVGWGGGCLWANRHAACGSRCFSYIVCRRVGGVGGGDVNHCVIADGRVVCKDSMAQRGPTGMFMHRATHVVPFAREGWGGGLMMNTTGPW